MTGLQQSGLGLDVLARLVERIVDGSRRVTDLQTRIPERVEDSLYHELLSRFQGLGAGFRGIEKHQIDVAQRAKLSATVASDCDERNRDAIAVELRLVGLESRGSQFLEEDVDDDGERIRYVKASRAFAMQLLDRVGFGFQKIAIGGEFFGLGGLIVEMQALLRPFADAFLYRLSRGHSD